MNQHYLIMQLIIRLFFIFFLSSANLWSQDILDSQKDKKFSLNFASFTHHLYNPNKNDDYIEKFDNQLIVLGYKIAKNSRIAIGTLKNSYDDRCLVLGLEQNFYNFNSKFSFEGFYAYSGEFFFDSFANCGNQGRYKDFKNASKIGFVPYIYHGLSDKFNPSLSLKSGIILPGVLASWLQWSF